MDSFEYLSYKNVHDRDLYRLRIRGKLANHGLTGK